jgi:hypothetical protein
MQFNAIFGNFTQMPAIPRSFTKTNANYRKFQQDRGIAVADAQAILRTGLTSPDTLLLPFDILLAAPTDTYPDYSRSHTKREAYARTAQSL